eukprot:TRINITY_DN218_c0_g1_i3.p1 TRINITY_DN218_c0_g1~~TRINITY_DN218_c0_g1_i3.p1  ORF type:complete len:276 (+),score=73.80 TRINITY_DN218_c0_g1_i3:234-1061(+)
MPWSCRHNPIVISEDAETTANHKQCLERLQAAMSGTVIADPFKLSDEDLMYRFLIAAKYDVAAAETSLRGYLQWRQESRTDAVFTEQFDPKIPQLYPCGFCGVDKEGHPLYYERPSQDSLRELIKLFTQEDLLRWHMMCQERCRELFRHMGTDRISVVVDCAGIGMSIAADMKALGLLKALSVQDQRVYPETMRFMFVINAPFAVTTVWKIVSPLLDERVRKKIHIFGGNWLAQIQEYVDPSQLPTDYGGTGGRQMTTLGPDPSSYSLAQAVPKP